METVAVFAENPIRVYELALREGLVLVEARCPADNPAGAAALALADPPLEIAFYTARWDAEGSFFSVCLPEELLPRFSRLARQGGLAVQSARPASLIHLQGPHFGDRYGIASAALEGLARAGVEPLAVQGAVHSLFVAADPPDADRARDGLSAYFCAPE